MLGSAVVRVMDVEATFRRRSALPGETVTLTVQTDAPWLRLTLLQCGPEDGPTNSNYEMRGVPVGQPQRIDLRGRDGRPTTVPVTLDVPGRADSTPRGSTGLRVTSGSPRSSSGRRLPCSGSRSCCRRRRGTPTTTTTGTATASATPGTRSSPRSGSTSRRPHLRRGVPERFRSYDVQFLHWLASRGHAVDTYADEDIDLFPSPQALSAPRTT